MSLLKALFIVLGTLSLAIGVLGIFVPGLPTTVFLLLTAGLYVKSSDRMYNWLISNPYLGKYILDFRRRKGMTSKQKAWAIVMMWTMILLSIILLEGSNTLRLVIAGPGVIGTIVIGLIVRTVND